MSAEGEAPAPAPEAPAPEAPAAAAEAPAPEAPAPEAAAPAPAAAEPAKEETKVEPAKEEPVKEESAPAAAPAAAPEPTPAAPAPAPAAVPAAAPAAVPAAVPQAAPVAAVPQAAPVAAPQFTAAQLQQAAAMQMAGLGGLPASLPAAQTGGNVALPASLIQHQHISQLYRQPMQQQPARQAYAPSNDDDDDYDNPYKRARTAGERVLSWAREWFSSTLCLWCLLSAGSRPVDARWY